MPLRMHRNCRSCRAGGAEGFPRAAARVRARMAVNVLAVSPPQASMHARRHGPCERRWQAREVRRSMPWYSVAPARDWPARAVREPQTLHARSPFRAAANEHPAGRVDPRRARSDSARHALLVAGGRRPALAARARALRQVAGAVLRSCWHVKDSPGVECAVSDGTAERCVRAAPETVLRDEERAEMGSTGRSLLSASHLTAAASG